MIFYASFNKKYDILINLWTINAASSHYTQINFSIIVKILYRCVYKIVQDYAKNVENIKTESS